MQSPRLGTMAGGQSRTGARREDNRTAAAPASTFCCLSVFLERRVASCEALYRGAMGGSGPRETALRSPPTLRWIGLIRYPTSYDAH